MTVKTFFQKVGQGILNGLKKTWVFLKPYLAITWTKLKPALISIVIGLLVGLIIMLVVNPAQAFQGFMLLLGGFTRIGNITSNMGDILFKATPILVMGLALIVAFRSGLFNIGGSGQMFIGAFVAVYIGARVPMPAPWHFIVAMLGGVAAGFVWGLIPGLLKAFRNTNEVVATIMMNYISMYFVVSMVYELRMFNPATTKTIPVLESAWLPRFGEGVFSNSQLNIGFLIALLVVFVVHTLIYHTKTGYELQATGFNKDASLYAGMNSKANVILSMSISGMLAGLAGALFFLSNFRTTLGSAIYNELPVLTTLLPEGFTGISVALLASNEPIGAVFSSIFLSFLSYNSAFLTLAGYKQQIADIIISVIVYSIGISAGIQFYFGKLKLKLKKKNQKTVVKGEPLQ